MKHRSYFHCLLVLIVLIYSDSYGALHRFNHPALNPEIAHLLTDAHLKTLVPPEPSPPASNAQPWDFLTRFNNIFSSLRSPDQLTCCSLTAQAISTFNAFFFTPRPNLEPNLTEVESDFFLKLLKATYGSIQMFCNHPNSAVSAYLNTIFKDSLEFINDRYGLQKIEHSILTGNGFLGASVHTNIPDNPGNADLFRNTIRSLSGRIFVVKMIGGCPCIVGFSSGIIIPKSRFIGSPILYNEIITCCHSITLKDKDLDPELELYFVRSENLNPNTGLPNLGDIDATPGALPQPVPGALTPDELERARQKTACENLVIYLRHASGDPLNNTVRRIEKFRPISQEISDLTHHCPKYNGEPNDCGYGILNRSFNFPVDSLAPIHVMNHTEVDHMISHHAVFDYYALGYPTFSYHSLGVAFNEPLFRLFRLSPLTLTKGNSATTSATGQQILRIQNDPQTPSQNNLLHHEAPIMKGMSGGPVFMIEGENINIMGIVRGGHPIGNQLYAAIL